MIAIDRLNLNNDDDFMNSFSEDCEACLRQE